MRETVDVLRRQAETRMRAGQAPRAISAYRRLLALRGDLGDCWYNLGYLLRGEGRFDEALEAYAQALVHGAAAPEEIHLNRAAIFSDHLRRDDRAESELRAALGIDPDYLPALLNLGNLQEERGRHDQAIATYERVLFAAGSDCSDMGAEALARLARLRAPTTRDDPLLRRLRDAVASPSPLATTERANLHFAIGTCCDRMGHYDDAFAAFTRGNELSRIPGAYARERIERHVATLIGLPDSPPARPQARADNGAGLVFICGMYRSGSTLLEQVLAGHSRVIAGGELDTLPRLVRRTDASGRTPLTSVDPVRDQALAHAYRRHLATLLPEAGNDHLVTDKRPDNFLLIGVIKRLFPAARIVHTVRDPLDTCLSVFMQHLQPGIAPYAGDLSDIGHFYGQYRRLMAHWKARYADSIHDFSYESFVADPEGSLHGLLRFLGLPWQDRCLQFHRLGNTVKTASYWQVRQPLHARACGRWRHYEAHLAPLRQALAQAAL